MILADLRAMKNSNNGLTPRPDFQNAPTQAAAPVSNAPMFSLPDLSLPELSTKIDTGHGRGGHGIFGEPKVCNFLNKILQKHSEL